MATSLDVDKLERAVKSVYRDVATDPGAGYHFDTGRSLAEHLGYAPADLDRIPSAALESFAGVGYYFDLAAIEPGDDVLDLGSGSGTDAFVAALQAGETGSVTGLDMTEAQLEKSRVLAEEAGFETVRFERGYIEDLPFEDGSFDVVISNGVINLSPDKEAVFAEAHRVLGPDGRLAIADIISEELMPKSIKTDEELWAACIGGAEQVDRYSSLIEAAGFELVELRENEQYEFRSEQAASACQKYGVKSVSLAADRT
ncbi:MAG: methyltransferase domain-containing protein [Halobacteriales archaeon]